MTDVITKTAFFAASRETVWSFLTDKDKLAQWFHPADVTLTQGQDYALLTTADRGADKVCWGKVLETVAPETLVYTFTFKAMGGAMTTVTWTLEEVPGGTRLTLKHEGIAAAAGDAALGMLMSLDAGWDEHIGQLRKAAA